MEVQHAQTHPPRGASVHAQAKVRLVAWTAQPAAIAVASARTCYAADFQYVGRLGPKGERIRTDLATALPNHIDLLNEIGSADASTEARGANISALLEHVGDKETRQAVRAFGELARRRGAGDVAITRSIYDAGHHTPFQHPTFVFALEGVSRHVVESFLHQHTFYNSEQQSQRYVEMRKPEVVVPISIQDNKEALHVFEEAVDAAWQTYHMLRNELVGANEKVMGAIARIKGQDESQARVEAGKKAQEMARYVIPVAAATKLYHTISGIVLLRYLRMCQTSNVPGEAKRIVDAMVGAVREVDPAFLDRAREVPASTSMEERLVEPFPLGPGVELGQRTSKLVAYTNDGPAAALRAMREVTGTTVEDGKLMQMVMDPASNPTWNDTLNTWDHSALLRSLKHVHYTFHKRASLTAYAQDQRHRLTPATRPLVQRAVHGPPDVYVPDVVDAAGQRDSYDRAVAALWNAMRQLLGMGIPDRDVAYLLPNATNIYYTQSGDALSWIHKWRLRLCFNAQKEIFAGALDELRQVQEVHPELTRWIGPPCSFMAAAVPEAEQDNVEACCPEGPRWCGVKVWKNFDAAKGRPKRPY